MKFVVLVMILIVILALLYLISNEVYGKRDKMGRKR